MVRMNPPNPAAAWWRVHFMGWVVPLSAAAAVVVIWMYMPAPRVARQAPGAVGPAAESTANATANDQVAASPAAPVHVESEPSRVESRRAAPNAAMPRGRKVPARDEAMIADLQKK